MNWLITLLGGYTKKQVADKIAEAGIVQTEYWTALAFDVETGNMKIRLTRAENLCTIFLQLSEEAKRKSHKRSHLETYAKMAKADALSLEIDIKLRNDK